MNRISDSSEEEKPTPSSAQQLSRRERQIMDIIYPLGKATAAQVRDAMSDAPGYSAVRAMLRILEEKGHLSHEIDRTRYVYLPTRPRGQEARSMLRQVVQTFFGGSVEQTVATLLSTSESKLSSSELERLAQLIEKAKEEGR
jgi:predicted transcriptional regulator